VKTLSSGPRRGKSETLAKQNGDAPEKNQSGIPGFFNEPFILDGDTLFVDFRVSQDNDSFPRGAVMFLPQGNSTGGEFILGPENGPYYSVAIDPVTGRVHMDLAEGY